MGLREINAMFNDCYKLYKQFRNIDFSDTEIQEFMAGANEIYEKYNSPFCKDVVLSVITEMERIEKQRNEEEME